MTDSKPKSVAQQSYERAAQRLAKAAGQALNRGGIYQPTVTVGNAQLRQVEIAALLQLLDEKGILPRDEFYSRAERLANERSDKFEPSRIQLAVKSALNGSLKRT